MSACRLRSWSQLRCKRFSRFAGKSLNIEHTPLRITPIHAVLFTHSIQLDGQSASRRSATEQACDLALGSRRSDMPGIPNRNTPGENSTSSGSVARAFTDNMQCLLAAENMPQPHTLGSTGSFTHESSARILSIEDWRAGINTEYGEEGDGRVTNREALINVFSRISRRPSGHFARVSESTPSSSAVPATHPVRYRMGSQRLRHCNARRIRVSAARLCGELRRRRARRSVSGVGSKKSTGFRLFLVQETMLDARRKSAIQALEFTEAIVERNGGLHFISDFIPGLVVSKVL
jgi:hypothetical protein